MDILLHNSQSQSCNWIWKQCKSFPVQECFQIKLPSKPRQKKTAIMENSWRSHINIFTVASVTLLLWINFWNSWNFFLNNSKLFIYAHMRLIVMWKSWPGQLNQTVNFSKFRRKFQTAAFQVLLKKTHQYRYKDTSKLVRTLHFWFLSTDFAQILILPVLLTTSRFFQVLNFNFF